MSVVEPERHKGRLEVHVKAQALAAYTALIVKNPKVFDPEVDEDLIKRIKSYSMDIYEKAWAANKINAETNQINRAMRYQLQEEALLCCDWLHMVLISKDKIELEKWREIITEKLAGIGFEVHPKKTKIVPLRNGFMWLGYWYRLTDTGKVVMTLDPERVNAARRKYYRLVQKVKRGELTKEKVDESYQCWRNHASKGDGRRMLYNMDRYYQNLWKGWETNAEDCKKAVPPCGGRPG